MTVEPGIPICVFIMMWPSFLYIHWAPHAFFTGIELQHDAQFVESNLPKID